MSSTSFCYELPCNNCDYKKGEYCTNEIVNNICKNDLLFKIEYKDNDKLKGIDACRFMNTNNCKYKDTSNKYTIDLLKALVQLDKNLYLKDTTINDNYVIFEGINNKSKRKEKIKITFTQEELKSLYKCNDIENFIKEYKNLKWE